MYKKLWIKIASRNSPRIVLQIKRYDPQSRCYLFILSTVTLTNTHESFILLFVLLFLKIFVFFLSFFKTLNSNLIKRCLLLVPLKYTDKMCTERVYRLDVIVSIDWEMCECQASVLKSSNRWGERVHVEFNNQTNFYSQLGFI